jgi:aromatic ring-cleaving dioxygenase
VATFQVDLMTPTQFGAFVPWIAVNRCHLSVLVHPNTDRGGMDRMRRAEEAFRDHTDRAIWIGTPWPLDTDMFRRQAAKAMAKKVQQ